MPIHRNDAYVPKWESTRPEPSFLRNVSVERSPEEENPEEGLDRLQRGLVLLGGILVAFSIFMDIRNYLL